MPNLVSRLGTNPEFSQKLKFLDLLEIQDGSWQELWDEKGVIQDLLLCLISRLVFQLFGLKSLNLPKNIFLEPKNH